MHVELPIKEITLEEVEALGDPHDPITSFDSPYFNAEVFELPNTNGLLVDILQRDGGPFRHYLVNLDDLALAVGHLDRHREKSK